MSAGISLLDVVFSMLLTWGIGLAPALIARYLWVKRPVRPKIANWIAGVSCFIFFFGFRILNAALGVDPGSTTGGLVWAVVFLVSRAIMTTGYDPRTDELLRLAEPGHLEGSTTRTSDVIHSVKKQTEGRAPRLTTGVVGSPESLSKPITLNQAALAAAVVALSFLLYALATVDERHEDGHFVLLRLIVSVSALIWTFERYRTGRILGLTLAGLVVLLFNPFLPVEYLEDDDDSIPFIIGAAMFFGAMLFVKGLAAGWITRKRLLIAGGATFAATAILAFLALALNKTPEEKASATNELSHSAALGNAMGADMDAMVERARADHNVRSRSEFMDIPDAQERVTILDEPVDSAWLIGSWVEIKELDDPESYCSSDFVFSFDQHGEYSYYLEIGNFKITEGGFNLSFSNSSKWISSKGDGVLDKQIPVAGSVYQIAKRGERLILSGDAYSRCS